jgi:putative membrane protein
MLSHTVCPPGYHGFFWFPFIPIFFFGFWILVLFVFRPWAWGRRGWGPGSPAGSAEAVLAERYARGEVTEEEYRARLEVLRTRR